MNRFIQSALVASAAMVLSACASSGGMASAPTPAPQQQGVRILTDVEYVSNVERRARDRGVVVQWVNPPQKRFVPALASR